MSFSFENSRTHTYFVYTFDSNDTIDTMSLGQITNNKISGLAPAMYSQRDAMKYIKYDVSSKVQAKEFLSGVIDKKRLLGVLRGVADAILSADGYMIDVNSILLDMDCIFSDVSTSETLLICLPIISDDLHNVDYVNFFKNVVMHAHFDQDISDIMNFLNSAKIFSLAEFKKLLDRIADKRDINIPTNVNPNGPKTDGGNPNDGPTTGGGTSTTGTKQPVVPGPHIPKNPDPPVYDTATKDGPTKPGFWERFIKKNNSSDAQSDAGATTKPSRFTPPGVIIPGQEREPIDQNNVGSNQNSSAGQGQKPSQPSVNNPGQQTTGNSTTGSQPSISGGTSVNEGYGDTVILGGAEQPGATTILGGDPKSKLVPKPFLVRAKNNEIININKPVFRIGRDREYADYLISDNTAISRAHANIISKDGEYFVKDVGSKYNTFVNGQMIQSRTEVKIEHATKIRFADEDFEFKLY